MDAGSPLETPFVKRETAETLLVDFQTPPPPPAPSSSVPGLLAGVLLAAAAVTVLLQRRRAAAAAEAAPRAGDALGGSHFRIVRPIGAGGMGVVYEAIDTNLDRRVAVKRMRDRGNPDEVGQASLIKEAKTVAALRHPNIVDIHAVVTQGGHTYLVFEYVEGLTLEQLLARTPHPPVAHVKGILDPVCRALEYAHGEGIVHRDLKLANVMLTRHGQVKIMDFGIARQVQMRWQPRADAPPAAEFGVTDTLLGTTLYQSPESEYGVVRPEVDVFALGVMTYRLLAGDWPFPPPASVDVKLKRGYARLSTRVPSLGAAGDALIDDALEPDPDKRLRTAREFRERLAALPS